MRVRTLHLYQIINYLPSTCFFSRDSSATHPYPSNITSSNDERMIPKMKIWPQLCILRRKSIEDDHQVARSRFQTVPSESRMAKLYRTRTISICIQNHQKDGSCFTFEFLYERFHTLELVNDFLWYQFQLDIGSSFITGTSIGARLQLATGSLLQLFGSACSLRLPVSSVGLHESSA